MKDDFIFVYGLLKSMYENEPAQYIRRNCTLIGEGFFPGKLVDIGTYPGAIFDETSQTSVYGEVYKIERNKEELFAFLDHFEGVGPEFEEPNEYKRELIPVQLGDKKIHASCYVYNWNSDGLKVIESGRYENADGTRN
jgi:gamma-glutamylcyclotransferase (GGCT)/AIG2-like uncharacterized protein YtfP